jgi:hypothetical protein
MSLVEDEMHRSNALSAEARRKSNLEHMAEMAQKGAEQRPKVVEETTLEGSVQNVWKKRRGWWSQVLAAKQQKK